jgi:hypothetical protein
MRSLGNGGGGGGGAFCATIPRAHALVSRVRVVDAPKRCFPLALRAMVGAGGRGGARWCEEHATSRLGLAFGAGVGSSRAGRVVMSHTHAPSSAKTNDMGARIPIVTINTCLGVSRV